MKSFFVNLGKLALCGAVVAMIGCTDLHSDIKLVQSNSDKAVAELQEALDALEADLAKDYALKSQVEAVEKALSDEITALDKAMDAMATKEELTKAIQEATVAVTEAMTALDGLDGRVGGLEERLANLEEACKAYLDEATVKDLINAEVEALKAYINEADEAIKKDVEDLRALYEALPSQLEAYATDEDLKEVVARVEAIENAGYLTADDLAELNDAVETANKQITDVAKDVDDLQTLTADVKADVVDLQTSVTALEAEIKGLATLKENLEKKLDKDVFETYKKEVDAKLAELETMKKELADLGKELEAKYQELKNSDEELNERINVLEGQFNSAILSIENRLNDMEVVVNDLAARVQSLVFIPEYSDGKATIEWGLLIDNDSAVNFLYNTVISYNTLDTFKTYAKKFINKVRGSRYYAYIVRQMKYVLNEMEDAVFGPLDDINAQLDAIFKEIEDLENNLQIDTPDADEIAEAFNELFGGIEDLVSYYVADQLEKQGFSAESDDVNPQEITDKIIADLKEAFTFGEVDVNIDLPGFQLPDYKTIVKNLIKKYVKYFKAEGISKLKDIINALESGNISANDIIDGLKLVEFRELLSDLLPVAKKLEAMILENTAILKKESVIRYKVLAQDAEAVAADIATNWKKVLYYDVEAVDVRAAAPALEITKVVAKGDEIHVTVLPQNFNYRFYLTYILEDSFLYGAAESFFDKFGKTGLISYSAALVLNDGNNIRSTEYVNFVSGENPEIFTPEVVKNGVVVETETIDVEPGAATVTLCEGMDMGYLSVPKREILTDDQLVQKGYSGFTESRRVDANSAGEAYPCIFTGLTGAIYDSPTGPVTFTTYWSVNDIVLTVKSKVNFLP